MWNADLLKGLVNGSRGIVAGFCPKGRPVVRFRHTTATIARRKWKVHDGVEVVAVREQVHSLAPMYMVEATLAADAFVVTIIAFLSLYSGL